MICSTFNGNVALTLSLSTVGYETKAMFQKMSRPVVVNLKFSTRTDNATSARTVRVEVLTEEVDERTHLYLRHFETTGTEEYSVSAQARKRE